MSDWDDLVEPARAAFEALLRKCDDMVDRIEELEAKGLANRMAIMRLEAKLAKTGTCGVVVTAPGTSSEGRQGLNHR